MISYTYNIYILSIYHILWYPTPWLALSAIFKTDFRRAAYARPQKYGWEMVTYGDRWRNNGEMELSWNRGSPKSSTLNGIFHKPSSYLGNHGWFMDGATSLEAQIRSMWKIRGLQMPSLEGLKCPVDCAIHFIVICIKLGNIRQV